MTLLLCTLVAEVGVRLFLPQSDLRQRDLFFQYEPFIGWEGIPNKKGVFANPSFKTTISHNSQGFRDREHTFENTTGKFRILAMGDSFTWGHGVDDDEIYMKVLEGLDDRIETVNLGGPGSDPARELKVYTARGIEYEHDLVLVGFYIGNDIVTRRPSPKRSPPDWGFDEDGVFRLIGTQRSAEEVEQIRQRRAAKFAAKAERSTREELEYWLTRRLQVLTLLGNRRDYLSERLKGSALYTRVRRALGKGTRKDFPLLEYCEEEDGEDVAYGWRLAEATLAKFQEFTEEAGARFYLMFIPDMYQTWPDYYATTARRYGYDPDLYDLEKPNRVLAEICEKLGIPYLDLLPGMREAMSADIRLYHRRDRHWNAEGHRFAARALRADLVRRGWLDGIPSSGEAPSP